MNRTTLDPKDDPSARMSLEGGRAEAFSDPA